MIAEQMRKLFAYNNWAWQRVFSSVEQLDHAGYMAPRALFGDSSMHQMLVHAMGAEYIWYARCRGESPAEMLSPADFADFTAVATQWGHIIHRWGNFIQMLHAEDCERIVTYQTTQGQTRALLLADLLQHVVNHATEHRSQITPLLYELGVPTQPLDYMLFTLKR